MWRLFCIFPLGIERVFFPPNKIYENPWFKVSALLLLQSEAVSLFTWVLPASFTKSHRPGQAPGWDTGAAVGRVYFKRSLSTLEAHVVGLLTTNRGLNIFHHLDVFFKKIKFILSSSLTAPRAWWAGPGLEEYREAAGSEQRSVQE